VQAVKLGLQNLNVQAGYDRPFFDVLAFIRENVSDQAAMLKGCIRALGWLQATYKVLEDLIVINDLDPGAGYRNGGCPGYILGAAFGCPLVDHSGAKYQRA